ncbi:MAG: DUF3341 domain-containing protein [Verrucomicrobiota bacterium]
MSPTQPNPPEKTPPPQEPVAREANLRPGQRLYAVGAEFSSVQDVYHAAEKCRDKGFLRWDVHSPFPIHGLNEAMGVGKSWVSALSLGGAATGLTTAVLLQTIPSVFVYPMVVQGKPYFSLEAFVPIMFELTILLTAFGTVGGMLLFNLLPRLNHPVFNWEYFNQKCNDDGFFIVIEASDPRFEEGATSAFLEEIGGRHVTFIPMEAET